MIPKLLDCQYEHQILYDEDFQIAVVKDFVSKEEIKKILNFLDSLDNNRATTVTENGKSNITSDRTCQTYWNPYGQWPTKELMDVDKRICKLFNWKACNIENWSFIKYGLGQRYNPHQDYLSESTVKVWGFQRVGTLIVYIKEAEKGGNTTFPLLKKNIAAESGDAIFFNYKPNVTVNSLHGGSRVVKGEKIIATRWFKNVI